MTLPYSLKDSNQGMKLIKNAMFDKYHSGYTGFSVPIPKKKPAGLLLRRAIQLVKVAGGYRTKLIILQFKQQTERKIQ